MEDIKNTAVAMLPALILCGVFTAISAEIGSMEGMKYWAKFGLGLVVMATIAHVGFFKGVSNV